jgi:hypothetical protein
VDPISDIAVARLSRLKSQYSTSLCRRKLRRSRGLYFVSNQDKSSSEKDDEATATCLEGRCSHNHPLLDTESLYRLIEESILVFTHVSQKLLHAFFNPTGKSFHLTAKQFLTRFRTYQHYNLPFERKQSTIFFLAQSERVVREDERLIHMERLHSSGSR